VDTQRLQCIINKQALPKNRCWRLACVTDLVGTNGLCAVKTGIKKCLVLLGTGYWLQSKHVGDHTHTSFLSFACSTDKSKAKIKCGKNDCIEDC
jgi:hypothetical protein